MDEKMRRANDNELVRLAAERDEAMRQYRRSVIALACVPVALLIVLVLVLVSG